MLLALPTITIIGRTYKPALDATETAEYLLENFDDEAFSSSELISDLEEKAVNTVYKLDDENGTYALTFSGSRDEFPTLEGPILSKDMVKAGVLINAVETLQDNLEQEGVDYWNNGREWFYDMEPQLIYAY